MSQPIIRDIIWLPTTRPSAQRIIAEVASRHGLSVAELIGDGRHRAVSRPRHEAMWELRQLTTLSLPQIARRLGRKDHTTVLHGIRAHAARLAEQQGEAA